MRDIYFDNAGSTFVTENVLSLTERLMRESYANPAALSNAGAKSEAEISRAKKTLAGILNCYPDEIFFTSGGTESDNLALFGTSRGYFSRGKHIITQKTEHPAITESALRLSEEGFEVEYAPVDENGVVDTEALSNLIRSDTVLVSIAYVNNETGTLQDIEKIGCIVKEKNPSALFHTDAVQAFGKHAINVKKMRLDMLSASGHKIHAPKGVGLFYMKKGLKIKPIIYGGNQQSGLRSGTENTPGSAAMALAAEEAYACLDSSFEKIKEVKSTLFYGIAENIPDVVLNGCDIETASPYVLNLSFLGIGGEVLLHALENEGIYISTGSACGSRKKSYSKPLTAMGLSEDRLESAVRFSFSRFSTIAEAKETVRVLSKIVPELRRYKKQVGV